MQNLVLHNGEEHRLGVSENTVLMAICRHKRDEVGGRNLHNKGFYDLNFSPNIVQGAKSRRMKWMAL